jgi:diaminopimelate epimerase
MNFTKMQGAGNDFVLMETSDLSRDWSSMAKAVCDRHYGIGADGLLLLMPSDVADFRMRIFNVDGSEAEACGNGVRCLVKYYVDNGSASSGAQEISVETIAGVRRATVHRVNGEVSKVQIGMGEPELRAENIPVLLKPGQGNIVDIKLMICHTITVTGWELPLNLVSLGNPHAVYFYQHPVSDFPLSQLGPVVEKHKIFPNHVNFEVARIVSKNEIGARVWEKGVGETLACGSGACAIVVAAQLHGYVNNRVDVRLPGGILGVEWDGKGEVLLSGPAEIVFSGEWPD